MHTPISIMRLPFPPTLALYRRIYRLRNLIQDVHQRRRFIYNCREVIALYTHPECIQSEHWQSESLPQPCIDKMNEQIVSPFEVFIKHKIQLAHEDLNVFERILSSSPSLVSHLFQSFSYRSSKSSFGSFIESNPS
jgi:hypothetical protein